MAFSITYAGNGNFNMTVDGQTTTFNLADLDMMLRTEQVAQHDQEIAEQMQSIQESNVKRKALNELLTQMRKSKEEGRDDDSTNPTEAKGSVSFELSGYEEEGSKTVAQWMDRFGITRTDVQGGDSNKTNRDNQWEASITAVRTEVDNITSQSESEFLRFRQLVDKRSTALQEAKTTLSNDKRLKDTILQG